MVILRGKFIAWIYIKKLENSHTSNLKAHMKFLEQKEEITTQRSRQQEIIQLRTEVNKNRNNNNKIYKNQLNTKVFNFYFYLYLLFEKISKNDKLAKSWRKKIHINKTKNERDNIIVDTEEIQKIIRENFKSLYSNKFRNLKKGIISSTQTVNTDIKTKSR